MSIDHSNPLAVSLPYNFTSPHEYPTEVLANRFQAWRSIIKDLLNYLKEYASVQEEIIRQQVRLQQAVGTATTSATVSSHASTATGANNGGVKDDIVAINKYFLPIGNGSIQDLPTILTKFHQQNVTNGSKTLKEINSLIIPKLEELRKDLLIKIKEIKNLQSDFKTDLGREIQETKKLLSQYQQAIDFSNKLEASTSASSHHHLPNPVAGVDGTMSADSSKFDPFLVKLKLDRQLKKQLLIENYLYDAYANLQNSGGKLESIVVLEVQNYLGMFLNLVESEHLTIPNYLIPHINNGFLTKDAGFEWDSFISRHLPITSALQQLSVGNVGSSSSPKSGTFIDLTFPARKLSDFQIPNFDTALNISIREGYLERRSKFLKSYSSGWYVLTCNFIHEFKSPDRKKDPQPVMSLLLDSCLVSEHSKDDGKVSGGVYKFVLYSKGLNIRHRSHNWVFRTDTYKNMIDWYTDIKNLTTLATPAARARFIAKRDGTSKKTAGKPSRPSSIFSTGTNARTIKSGESTETGKIAPSIKSSTNPRLSSTFSHRNNNNSPRLPKMINSDGTIITPVESRGVEDKDVNPDISQHTNAEQHQNQGQQSQLPHQQQQQQQQQPLQPQQQYLPIPVSSNPNGFVPAGGYQGYYIPGQPQTGAPAGQPQQFYDPVKQQYYTISPTMQPQPQYFPATPQQPNQQYFTPSGQPQTNQSQQAQQQTQQQGNQQGGQLFPVSTAHYFPQSPQIQPQYNDVASLGSYLPYPPNNMPPPTVQLMHEDYHTNTTTSAPNQSIASTVEKGESNGNKEASNDNSTTVTQNLSNVISQDGDIILDRQDLQDEVDTLPSAGSDDEEK